MGANVSVCTISLCFAAQRQMPGQGCRSRPPLHARAFAREEARLGVTTLTCPEVVAALGLGPHPEGGFYRETFRAPAHVSAPFATVTRAASTAIYFLLEAGDFSAFHSVRSDEVWHHYLGAPLELHTIDTSGTHDQVLLGPNLARGQRPQWVVPADTLQAARISGPGFGLFGCTVSPGFDFADFSMPGRTELIRRFPALSQVIEPLTR